MRWACASRHPPAFAGRAAPGPCASHPAGLRLRASASRSGRLCFSIAIIGLFLENFPRGTAVRVFITAHRKMAGIAPSCYGPLSPRMRGLSRQRAPADTRRADMSSARMCCTGICRAGTCCTGNLLRWAAASLTAERPARPCAGSDHDGVFLPLVLEAAVRLRRRPGVPRALPAGLVLGLAVFVNQESAIMAAIRPAPAPTVPRPAASPRRTGGAALYVNDWFRRCDAG